jgi:hypothetical protein
VSKLVDLGRLAAVAGPYQRGRGRRYCALLSQMPASAARVYAVVATSPIPVSVAEIAGLLECPSNSISPIVSRLVDLGRLGPVAGQSQGGRGRRYCIAGDPRTRSGDAKTQQRRRATQEVLNEPSLPARQPAATVKGGPGPEVPLSTLDRAIVNAKTILRPVTAAVVRRMLEDEYPTRGITLRLARLVELGHRVVESTGIDGHRYGLVA